MKPQLESLVRLFADQRKRLSIDSSVKFHAVNIQTNEHKMALHITSSKIFSINRMINNNLLKLTTISVIVLLLSNQLSLFVKCQDYEDLNPNSETANNSNNGASNGKSAPQFGRGSTNSQAAVNQANSNQDNVSQQTGKQSEQNGKQASSSASDDQSSELTNDQQTNGTSTANNNAGVHDTVYSDQRFASLFARRNQGKKLRPPPSEPIKAKPTLPSFIKSPPDLAMFQQTTPQPSSNSALASQRLQQQQRQQTSVNNQRNFNNNNTSNNANKNNINPRTAPAINANKNKINSNSSNATANGKVSTPAPVIKPLVNKFPANSNNDNNQSNIIALARKRFLANNALQNSAKARALPTNVQ